MVKITGVPMAHFTMACWVKLTTTGASETVMGQVEESSSKYAHYLYISAGSNLTHVRSNDGTSQHSYLQESGGTAYTSWNHVAVTRNGNTYKLYRNATETSYTGPSASSMSPSLSAQDIPFTIGRDADVGGMQGYMDQIICIKGAALSSTQLGHLAHANANTGYGSLGGLILHEEYEDGTNTANASTPILLHSNNATYHSQGSRKFYNDTANTRFTGTTGHEHAGYFTVGNIASPAAFNILGAHQTGYSPAMNNPTIRLRRGYSYIFEFAANTVAHDFYFANSTANSTGYAYGADSTPATNEYITGIYGSQTAPTVANKGSLTWTTLTAGDYGGYGDGTGTTEWRYLKYEVPTNAPKDLYYRCGVPHGAMGNAVFIMEATEPAPIKVSTLPALKTSTWNDKDYAGIGTTKSVIAFNGATTSGSIRKYLSIPDSSDWDFGTAAFAFEFWVNPSILLSNGDTIFAQYNESQLRLSRSVLGTLGFWDSNAWIDSTAGAIKKNVWQHIVVTRESTSSGGLKIYINGSLNASGTSTGNITGDGSALEIGRQDEGSNELPFDGFLDGIMVYKGISFNANTVIERYQAGRAGNHHTANSSCVLHIKSDSTYGDTAFTDSSPSAHTITNVGGVFHHIDDNRTANTALYFDGYSYIAIPNISDGTDELDIGISDFTAECWAKPDDGTASQYIMSNGGEGTSNVDGWNIAHVSGTTGFRPSYEEAGNHSWSPGAVGVSQTGPGYFWTGAWHHLAYVRRAGIFQLFVNGICLMNDATELTLNISGTQTFYIGRNHHESDVYFKGFLDGVRITKGMPRYTSGIPVDGQSLHKRYDDGRTANTANPDWATSSTRRYYGINTHTYLQTSEYATNANTVLMIRGDDAETANDGVNMYGKQGFHLEFKEVGAGTERDYNNFNTGAAGLGSDTSSTAEFADEATTLLLSSRLNQANGSVMFINEMDQSSLTPVADSHHNAANSVFSVDSNTANVSIASGGTRSY